jgi:uncharacterized membrane protein
MNELTGSYKSLRGTLLRTLIYTIGHFFIAAACVMFFTGAPWWIALTDAIVEPLLNGLWFFVLDRMWTAKND